MPDEVVEDVVDTPVVPVGNMVEGTPEAIEPKVEAPKEEVPEVKALQIPEAFKEKGWAKKVLNEDGTVNEEALFKQLDNLDGLVGKKDLIPDVATAEPEVLAEFFGKLKPKDHTAYNVQGVAEGTEETIQQMLFDAHVPKAIADTLIPKYLEYERSQIAGLYSEDGFKEEMKKSFEGDQSKVEQVRDMIKGSLSKEDLALLDDRTPNSILGAVYRLVEKLTGDYGIVETNKALQASGSINSLADAEKEAKEAYDACFAIKNKPTTSAIDVSNATARHLKAQENLRRLKGVQK